MSDYAHPEVLVTTEWISAHAKDSGLRLVEVDVDTTSYDQGHIDGAISWNWQTELQDAIRRDLADPKAFEDLLGKAGISPETTIVLYGDNNNWFAAWAFWQLKYYGHENVRLVNGGRKKWLEEKRPVTTNKPKIAATSYKVKAATPRFRAKREQIFSRRWKEVRCATGGRAVRGRIQRENYRASGNDGNGAARRTHTGRGEHTLGASGE